MQFTGTIKRCLPKQTGISKQGNPWAKQSYILEYQSETYPKQILFDVVGEDRINQFNIKDNDYITADINFTVNEYNGRCFNNVVCFSVYRPNNTDQAAPMSETPASSVQPQSAAPEEEGELPF